MQATQEPRCLEVDLSTGQSKVRSLTAEERDLYVGGRGLGSRLLYDAAAPKLDPFDDRMALVFAVGPLTGTSAPQSNRFVVSTKSPATGGLADSHCGGNFATKLRKAGYVAVVVRGKAAKPVTLKITDQAVTLEDASVLWGKGTAATQEALPAHFGKAVIGPAGENRVRYAAIVSQHRVAGRGGIGAVMGAKNLKAVIADGQQPVPIARPEEFKALQKGITEYLLEHPLTGGLLASLGTANLVMTTAGRNIIPTRNYQAGHDKRTRELSGERLRDEWLIKQDGCLSCPVRCGRKIKLRGVPGKGPEFETIGLLGNNLGIFDLQDVSELGALCDDLGLDTISMGNTLGFATELTERGMLQSDLAWGRFEAYRDAIHATARRDGLGAMLAEGTKRMAAQLGGEAFAIHVKGLELPAYDPRGCFGQGLEYATNNRGGCHIRGSTMFLEATGPLSIDPLGTAAKPELVIFQQNNNAAISSMSMCYFAAYAILPPLSVGLDPNGMPYRAAMKAATFAGPLLRGVFAMKNPLSLLWFEKFLTAVLGREISMGEFLELGERVYNLERLYNLREGLDGTSDKLPMRLLHEPTFEGATSGVPLAKMLPHYYKVRGWDGHGVPKPKTLDRLKIRA
ncbi:MAG TPA: aldehyde ferredoxin oxidoreductase family protein [Myxococcales bacterium]|jgi:aldehyde:ferredoxin oxidoreductase